MSLPGFLQAHQQQLPLSPEQQLREQSIMYERRLILQQEMHNADRQNLQYRQVSAQREYEKEINTMKAEAREYRNTIAEQKLEISRLKQELGGRDHTNRLYAEQMEKQCVESAKAEKREQELLEQVRRAEKRVNSAEAEVTEMKKEIMRLKDLLGLKQHNIFQYQGVTEQHCSDYNTANEQLTALKKNKSRRKGLKSRN